MGGGMGMGTQGFNYGDTPVSGSQIANASITDAKLDSVTQAQHEIEIIELQANTTVSPITHDSLISDTFSDTTGYNNTVQTGTTTATFSTDKYIRTSPSVDDDTGLTIATANNSVTQKYGCKITMTATKTLSKVTTASGCTSTKAYVYASVADGQPLGSPLASATITSNEATFALSLTNGNSYLILADNNGDAYDDKYQASPGYDITKTNCKFVKGINGSGGNAGYDTTHYEIQSVSWQDAASTQIIDIDLGTISGTVTATELVVNDPDRETGDAVKYKLKNATQSDDALLTDTYNTLTNLTTNPTGIEIQLIPKSSSPTDGYPSVRTFTLKIWKS